MPLYLRDPRKATHSFEIRGSHLGIAVERSTKTRKRSVALAELRKLERAIEQGEWPPAEPSTRTGEPTFLSAAVSYMQQGGERRYVGPLLRHFGEAALPLTQAAIDAASLALHPNAGAATRNRCVYTPAAAVMRHALGDATPAIRRPKGAKGRIRMDWLTEADATAVIRAADADLAILLTFLLYTGARLGEALALTWDDIDFGKRLAWIGKTKNGDPRTVLMRADVCALLEHRKGAGRVFPFRQGGHLKWKLRRATLAACGISAPERRPENYKTPKHRLGWVNFHSMRHTFASWFRRAGGDVQGLVATGNWRDPRSAARYAHVVARDEWARVNLMPKVG